MKEWTFSELEALYSMPLMKLISKAHQIHIHHHEPDEIQIGHLISVKTGGCPEDCKYCAQSSRYQTEVRASPLMNLDDVLEKAKRAKAAGATRICLGAALREVRDNKLFEEILHLVKAVNELGVEVCCTLGMLKAHQAKKLKEAGLHAYNHNLDSSENFYKTIITTRTYQERLDTLDVVQTAGLSVCCGAIIGMGEKVADRLELLHTLSKRKPHPDSVPINRLTRVPGTPFEHLPEISVWDTVRLIATARIVLPRSFLRLSSGRLGMSYAEQALCFFAGANSLFIGEKLLTVANPSLANDEEMFQILGIKKSPCYMSST